MHTTDAELAARLSKIEKVQRITSEPGEDEARVLIHCMHDIEESFLKLQTELLPKLLKTSDPTEIEDILHEMGEELAHIGWHINDSRFFALKNRISAA